ncbi:MAG: hypothetical protein HC896_03760 [Bacteroidales bacterium]|nr:hypothetical protein [Bacteroidales bacterium]
MHKKLVSTQPGFLLKYNIEKLLITECSGTIKNADVLSGSTFNTGGKSFEGYYSAKHKDMFNILGESYLETFCNTLCKRMQKLLKDNSIASVNLQDLYSSPIYMGTELYRPPGQTTFDGNLGELVNELVVNATGMSPYPVFPYPDARDPLYGLMAKIADSLNAQGNVRIRFGIELNQQAAPTITNYTVYLDTYITSYRKGNETIFKYKEKDIAVFALDKPVVSTKSFKSGNKVDMDGLDNELTQMFFSITEMFSFSVSEGL